MTYDCALCDQKVGTVYDTPLGLLCDECWDDLESEEDDSD